MFDRLEQKRRPVKTEVKDPKLQQLQEKLEAKKAGRFPLSFDLEICYMAESATWQDKATPAFWLATQAGPLWIFRVGPVRKSSLFGPRINHLLTRLVWSRWLDIGVVLFCVFIDPDFVSVNELGQYTAILTKQAWSMAHMYVLYFVWLTLCVEIIIGYLN